MPKTPGTSWVRAGALGVTTLSCGLLLGAGGISRQPAPAQTGPAPAGTRSIADFRPSRHGFHFTNSFSGSPLPQGMESLGQLVGAPSRYGLCGGMSFTAADYFLGGKPIPSTEIIPSRGNPLYDYIYTRQVESYDGLAAPAVFADWMRREDRGPMGNQAFTLAGLGAIGDELKAGKPVVLGLVFAKPGQPLWENHQVLACAVEHPSARQVDLRIYDPNHPLNDDVRVGCKVVIAGCLTVPGFLNVGVPVMGVECRLRAAGMANRPAREKSVRGIFAMPYQAATPPDGL